MRLFLNLIKGTESVKFKKRKKNVFWTFIKPTNLLAVNVSKVSVPLMSMCRWLCVVMADVKFLFATSSCLMSLVISSTICSLCSARSLIDLIFANSSLIDLCASASASSPACGTFWFFFKDFLLFFFILD